MKEAIIQGLHNRHSLIYKGLNIAIVASILYFGMCFFQLIFRDHSYYFEYESITPTSSVYQIGEPIYFTSVLERYRVADMQYNDTLFCGVEGYPFTWFSQSESEFKDAPKGKSIQQWRYDGYLPTIPMVCELRSSTYAMIGPGIHTNAQKITTSTFRIQ